MDPSTILLTPHPTPLAGVVAAALAICSACGSTSSTRATDAVRPPPREPSPLPAPLRTDLDAQVQRAFERVGLVPGMAIAVFTREGRYVRGFGVADAETREPVTTDTAFYIASSTKSYTALAMAILAQRGELDLDATLTRFAPGAPFPAAVRPDAVRLRDLLTHTHGMTNDAIGTRVAFTGEHDPTTLWQLLGSTGANAKAPLGTFEYTNDGYNMLTILTDRRLGVRWQDLLQREIFGPAGLTRTTAVPSHARAKRWSVAQPHAALGDAPQRIRLAKVDATMHSAGGILTSANDAARWLELMLRDGVIGDRRIVPAAVVRATRERIARVDGTYDGYARDHYGLGWHIGRYRDDVLVHHFGGYSGARAHISYMPERGVGVAVFVNVDGSPAALVDAVARYVYDRTAGRADAVATLDAALAAIAEDHARAVERIRSDRAARAKRTWTLTLPRPAYAGTYRNARYGTIDVAVERDALAVRQGILHAIAEPFTKPDSIRVELVPLRGEPIAFELAGGTAVALVYGGERFAR